MGILKNFFNMFAKKDAETDDSVRSLENESEQKGAFANKKLVNVIVIIVLGIILLIGMGDCGSSGGGIVPILGDSGNLDDFAIFGSAGIDIDDYRERLERDVSAALSRMAGAGEVRVTISFEHGGERVLATDRQATEERSSEVGSDSGRNNHRITIEDRVVLHGASNRGTNPIVVLETTPRISGVLVVAEGANDEQIRFELHRATRAVLGAPAHRIMVVAMESN